jgi:hypothetical protein
MPSLAGGGATFFWQLFLVLAITDLTLDPASCQANLGPENHGIKRAMVVFVITEGDSAENATFLLHSISWPSSCRR